MQEWERDRNERERMNILRDMKYSADQERQSRTLQRLSGKPGLRGELEGVVIQTMILAAILFVVFVFAGIGWVLQHLGIIR